MKVPTGREDIARLFENCLASEKLAQSYIIHGESGMGKKTVMNYILSLIMCDTHSSCDSCMSCKSLKSGAHPDVILLKRSEDKASIGVDRVRAVLKEVYIRPAIAGYKAVVVHEAHLLTAEAQNAMLKIIEEPPVKVVFFLLCDSLAPILQTIQSRSVTIKLKPLSKEELKEISKDSPGDFELRYCMGNPGKLISLLSDEEFLAFRDEVIDRFSRALLSDESTACEAIQYFEKNKDNRDEVFSVILSFVRDVLYKKLGMDSFLINRDKINYINAFKDKSSAKAFCKIMQMILNTQMQKGKNGSYAMAISVILFRCREEINGRSNRHTL